MKPEANTEWDGEICSRCGKPVMPTGIWSMPIDGFCACIFDR